MKQRRIATLHDLAQGKAQASVASAGYLIAPGRKMQCSKLSNVRLRKNHLKKAAMVAEYAIWEAIKKGYSKVYPSELGYAG